MLVLVKKVTIKNRQVVVIDVCVFHLIKGSRRFFSSFRLVGSSHTGGRDPVTGFGDRNHLPIIFTFRHAHWTFADTGTKFLKKAFFS